MIDRHGDGGSAYATGRIGGGNLHVIDALMQKEVVEAEVLPVDLGLLLINGHADHRLADAAGDGHGPIHIAR